MNTPVSFSYSHCCHLCLLVVLALFHFCLSNQNPENVLCMESEREALLKFKHGLTDEANRLASWVGEHKDCCKWAGIACDNSTGHVNQIHLPGLDVYYDSYIKDPEEALKRRLKGDISSSLLDLKQLNHLDLSCNDFEGTQVPKFIGSLQNLRYLNLSRSNFGGVIPPQLGNLSNLHVLSLGSFHYPSELTSMMNMQWLSSLGMLHHLDLSGVDLSKARDWIQVINTLHSLVHLHLAGCELSEIHPYVPSLNLTSLSLLDLSLNYFSSFMPQWIFSITSLVSLDLSWSNFNDFVPGSTGSFRNLTSLELLHVAQNDFMNSSSILEELSSTNLISLDLTYCGISSSLLESLHNLTSLLSLDLSENELTKRIPKSFGNLCILREIDLTRNKIGNIILTYFLESFLDCKSPALESLSLSENKIVGIIPHSIAQLSFLRKLDLSDNKLSGTIPYSIGQLSSLEELDIAENQLEGSLPDSIGRLSSLKVLRLSHNRLNGNLPGSIGQLSNLGSLDFSYNLMAGIVTETHFNKLESLYILDGTCNKLTLRPEDANWIPPFKIRHLFLKYWVLGPQFPLWLQSQKDLEYLDISNTSISSPMPESFLRSFPNIILLDIADNNIQGALTLSGIPTTLRAIDFGSNEFWGSLHHVLCSAGVTQIRVLNLGNNHLSGVVPECWEKWSSLKVLNLENNNLLGKIPLTLGYLVDMRSLNLHGNKISGEIPSSLMNMTELNFLQLERNELVGNIPTWIGTNLEVCNLKDVQILDLSHNNLSGNIPRCFNNFSVLSGIKTTSQVQFNFNSGLTPALAGDSLVMNGREDTYSTILGLVMLLDLSSNNLSGHIPSELTSLIMLTSLNLSSNQLTGRVPEKIGDMKSLMSLDLSLNKLSGELPESLSRLTFLSTFNVSYNKLIGKIPAGTQIQSFNESSFLGNKLYGAPLAESESHVPPFEVAPGVKKEDGGDWGLIISIVIGFVSGFWIIVGPVMVSQSWRIAYFRLLSKVR